MDNDQPIDATAVAAPLSSFPDSSADLEELWPGPAVGSAGPTVTPAVPLTLAGGQTTGSVGAGIAYQLASGMVAALRQHPDGAIAIALSPEELGGVRLRLEPDARDPERVVLHLAFDRPETLDLFRRHADQLAEAIRAAGYAEARLDFGQAGTGAQDSSGRSLLDDRDRAAAPQADKSTDPGPAPVRQLSHPPGTASGLDLRL